MNIEWDSRITRAFKRYSNFDECSSEHTVILEANEKLLEEYMNMFVENSRKVCFKLSFSEKVFINGL